MVKILRIRFFLTLFDFRLLIHQFFLKSLKDIQLIILKFIFFCDSVLIIYLRFIGIELDINLLIVDSGCILRVIVYVCNLVISGIFRIIRRTIVRKLIIAIILSLEGHPGSPFASQLDMNVEIRWFFLEAYVSIGGRLGPRNFLLHNIDFFYWGSTHGSRSGFV